MLRDTTPLKIFNSSTTNKQGGKISTNKLHGNILSSDERKQLFNTFMNEMN